MQEVFLLSVFMVDMETSLALGMNSPVKQAILDSFYDQLALLVKEKNTIDDFPRVLKNRLFSYREAIKIHHQNGPQWTVGKEFCKFCGDEQDLELLLLGMTFYTSTIGELSKRINTYKIIL